MIRRLFRFPGGSLRVTVRGKNASRFFSLCARYDIALREVKSCGEDTYSACMRKQDFYRTKPLVKKTRVRIRITGRHGLCFFLHRYRTRKAFGVAALAAAAGIFLLSGRIWRIEVVGNASLGEDAVLSYLKEQQIAPGTLRASIDNDALELSLRQDFDEVIWASVYEEGTKLVVCMQEKLATAGEEAAADTCMDLVAAKDATIASIITRNGLAAVKAGDEVKAGDILVNGRQEIRNDDGEVARYFYRSADADVLGYTTRAYEDWIEEEQLRATATGNGYTRYRLRVGSLQFTTPRPRAAFSSCDTTEETFQLCLPGSLYLPVYWGRISVRELEEESVLLAFSDAKTLALEHFTQFLTELEENGVRICDKNVMIEKIGKKYHIYGQVEVCEDIARQVATEVLDDPSEEGSKDEPE